MEIIQNAFIPNVPGAREGGLGDRRRSRAISMAGWEAADRLAVHRPAPGAPRADRSGPARDQQVSDD
jgi:hypothetical protein